MRPSPSEFRLATRLGLGPDVLEVLSRYAELVTHWNRKINLISRREPSSVWRRHLLDSAQMLPFLLELEPLRPKETWCDLGSGGGFPGLVLAVWLHFDPKHFLSQGFGSIQEGDGPKIILVEADAKKASFLREAIVALKLPTDRVDVFAGRLDTLPTSSADRVTARALASLPQLIGFSRHLLGPKGSCCFLKGERWQEEVRKSEAVGVPMNAWIVKTSLTGPGSMLGLTGEFLSSHLSVRFT